MRSPLSSGRRVGRLAALLSGVVAVAAGVVAYEGHAFPGVEQESLTLRLQARHAPRPSDVAVVAIDDQSFVDLRRQWPFPRSLHATVVRRLHEAGAKVVVLDVQFSDPSADPRQDLALWRALGRAGGAVLATSELGPTKVLGGEANLRAVHAVAAAGNLPQTDGVITHFPYAVHGRPTVAVAAAQRALGHRLDPSAFPAGGAWIDFRGPAGTIPSISFSRVAGPHADLRALARLVRGRVVVVGATSSTLQDVHPTPTSGRVLMPGPEVQANAIWTALHGLPLRDAAAAIDLLLVVLLGLAAPLARLRLRVLPAALVAVPAAAALAATAYGAFLGGRVVAVAAPLLALAVGTVAMVVASHLAESRERRRVTADNDVLEQLVRERTAALRTTHLEMVQRLGQAAESRDEETGHHIERISRLCERVALSLGMSPAEADDLRHASAMHDIGKIGIPDSILLKPGKLDADEWEVMKTHTTIGAEILAGSDSPLLQMAETIALTHHERFDGSGYPRGLRGEDIPLVGRICAVCDVFDALTSRRPYKEPWTVDEALDEIRSQRGRQFDPEVADVFLAQAPYLRADVSRARHVEPGIDDLPGFLRAA